MTIEMLQEALEKIPKTGAMNKARRRAILAQIYALQQEEAVSET